MKLSPWREWWEGSLSVVIVCSALVGLIVSILIGLSTANPWWLIGVGVSVLIFVAWAIIDTRIGRRDADIDKPQNHLQFHAISEERTE